MTAIPDAVKTSQTYAIDKTHSEVAFQVRHLLTKVRGRFTEFAGTAVLDQEHPEPVVGVADDRCVECRYRTPDRDTHLRADETGGFLVGDEVQITLSIEAIVR